MVEEKRCSVCACTEEDPCEFGCAWADVDEGFEGTLPICTACCGTRRGAAIRNLATACGFGDEIPDARRRDIGRAVDSLLMAAAELLAPEPQGQLIAVDVRFKGCTWTCVLEMRPTGPQGQVAIALREVQEIVEGGEALDEDRERQLVEAVAADPEQKAELQELAAQAVQRKLAQIGERARGGGLQVATPADIAAIERASRSA